MSKSPSEFVIFEKALEQKADEAHEAAKEAQRKRFLAKLQVEYDEFNERKRYVIENHRKLIGHKIGFEVYRIQNLPTHECIILDDLLLLPYDETYEEIKRVEEIIERTLRNIALDKNKCPGRSGTCEGELKSRRSFYCGGRYFDGLHCDECGEVWDYDDQFQRYELAFKELEKQGRTNNV